MWGRRKVAVTSAAGRCCSVGRFSSVPLWTSWLGLTCLPRPHCVSHCCWGWGPIVPPVDWPSAVVVLDRWKARQRMEATPCGLDRVHKSTGTIFGAALSLWYPRLWCCSVVVWHMIIRHDPPYTGIGIMWSWAVVTGPRGKFGRRSKATSPNFSCPHQRNLYCGQQDNRSICSVET